MTLAGRALAFVLLTRPDSESRNRIDGAIHTTFRRGT
jgi:hypothetical protein